MECTSKRTNMHLNNTVVGSSVMDEFVSGPPGVNEHDDSPFQLRTNNNTHSCQTRHNLHPVGVCLLVDGMYCTVRHHTVPYHKRKRDVPYSIITQ